MATTAAATTSVRRKTAPVRASSAAPGYAVQIRWHAAGGTLETLTLALDDRSFYPEVQRWRYVVANRRRLTPSTRDTLKRDVRAWLAERCALDAGVLDLQLKAMARAALVEVVVPFEREDKGWAARLFPWENTLGLLTDEAASFTVLRFLACTTSTAPRSEVPGSALLVRSGPAVLGTLYELERESQMVAGTLGVALAGRVHHLHEPDREALRAATKKLAPAIVHLSGVDPWALESHGLQAAEPGNTDGFVLRQAERGFDSVPPQLLAPLLCAGKPPPLLVTASSCYSASRLCSMAVAAGAQHAIGFFDTITDADVMLFFSSFYREWAQDWNLRAAFDAARKAWAAQAQNQSTGVVLWSRVSLLEVQPGAAAAQPAPPTAAPEPARVEDLKLMVALALDRGADGARAQRTSLNYSLLHNDRSPFSSFFIDKPLAGPLPPLQVEVALDVGHESCRCRFSEELPDAAGPVQLASRIRLPLVAGLLRQCTEGLRTNLYVKVSCGARLLRESTDRVTVLPADEWRDDGEDHRWLPSFVLPRDPAVLKIIGAAQRYLRTLLDDCNAGFDGYQQLNPNDDNAAAVVDPQVQAIWAAMQHDLPLNYINPPPSYTSQSQRLRSPSEVLRGQAATCIDLALLFASCLEFVGIYPVLFLIEGHAFPGYWRSDKAWWRMRQFKFDLGQQAHAEAAKTPVRTMSSGQSESWMFDGVDNLVELLRYVQEGTLVPFESTFVAARQGFYAALEEGSARLHPDSFDAMVDIQSARGENVTPLPLFDKFV